MGPTGQLKPCRAVIHSKRIADLLSLKEMSPPIEISRIGGKMSTAASSILRLSSSRSKFETQVEVFVIFTVITNLPTFPIATDLNILEGMPLADPDFRQPGPNDLNLGVGLYLRLVPGDLLRLEPTNPHAQGTRLEF